MQLCAQSIRMRFRVYLSETVEKWYEIIVLAMGQIDEGGRHVLASVTC